MTCGYAVDELRSCYSSTWRLFKDHPEILTPGYYYFNDDAPFFPGPTIFASRNFTTDDFTDPPLGEASGKQTWRNGSLPIPRPPATVVGDSSCVGNGDSYPLGLVSRNLPAGIDSRCWSNSGQVVPDPPPAMWFVAGDLAGLNDTDNVLSWKDRSVFGRDASFVNSSAFCTIDLSSESYALVVFSQLAGMQTPTFNLGGDFTVVAVAGVGPGGFGVHPKGSIASAALGGFMGPLAWGFNYLGSGVLSHFFTRPITLGVGTVFLMAARRVGTTTSLYLNGTFIGGNTDAVVSPIPVSGLATVQIQTGGGGTLSLAELQVYDQPLSDGGFAALMANLIATYGI